MSLSVPVAKHRFSIHTLSLQRAALLVLTPLALAFAGCGGGSGDAQPGNANLSAPATFTVDYGVKGYSFSWSPSAGAARYELREDPDGTAGPLPEVQIGGALTSTTYAHSLASQLLAERVNASYRVRACDASGCGAFSAALVPDLTKAVGYFKASNADKGDAFGGSVALSANGSTMAIGATHEASKATGANGDQSDDSATYAGAVYVFNRTDGVWRQQAYLKASNSKLVQFAIYPHRVEFGASLSLSANGDTLAVGAPGEASNAKGINGDQANIETPGAGAVYIFTRNSGQWSQPTYVKASNTYEKANYANNIGVGRYPVNQAYFGQSISLSADGNLLAVGAPGESSSATGINGDQADTSVHRAGAVYVFARDTSWRQQTYIKSSKSTEQARFGSSVAMAADGRTLAIGAPGESSGATGINGDQADTSAPYSGAAYLFISSGATWSQHAYVKASNTAQFDNFGSSVALSGIGDTVAVGALNETSNGTGINNAPGIRSLVRAGAAYVFTLSNGAWSQQAFIKASNTSQDDWFGFSIALSGDGNTLAVGAAAEASSSSGLTGNQNDNTGGGAGAVYLFQRSGSTWGQRSYIKASNTDAGDTFGSSVALASDGMTLAVGAPAEGSKSVGIQGNQTDNLGSVVGAVYLY